MFKYGQMNRRQCLQSIGMLGCGLLASPMILAGPARAGLEPKLQESKKTLPLMGTLISITVLDSSLDKACQAQEKAFSRMKELISIFDRHNSATPISYLNEHGHLQAVHPDLLTVLRSSEKYYSLSEGSFDITILPLLERNQKLYSPGAAQVGTSATKHKDLCVGSDYLEYSPKFVRFLKEDMQISMDGIAKGFIVDQAIYCLKEQGIDYALIEAGGDIRTIGNPKGQKTWKVGITDPWNKDGYVQILNLENGALATSGSYQRFFDTAQKHHHLIDSESGESPGHTVSCSVAAPTALEADALSTALFVKPPQKSLALANRLHNIEACLISPQGKLFSSRGWKSFTGKS